LSGDEKQGPLHFRTEANTILFFLDWNMSYVHHNSAASSWVCVAGGSGIEAKEF
jgi:hypothetical protein